MTKYKERPRKRPHAPLYQLLKSKGIALTSVARLFGRSDMWAQGFIKDPNTITLRQFYMLAGFIGIPATDLMKILETATPGGKAAHQTDKIGFAA